MVFTETGQTPWMSIAAAAAAAPTLTFSTGIAVAFPVSPMIAASIAWELAGNTGGRFRLGLGSQVKAHIERRYGVPFDPPGPRMRDYLLAVKDTLAAFRGERKLAHDGPYYQLSLLPDQWRPPMHEHGDIKVDVSAVGPWMTTMAGEVADGVHVHPLHSVQYLEQRLIPAVHAGAAKAGRVGRRRRPVDPGVHRSGRHARRTCAAHPSGPNADRVLRLDAELRVPVRRPRVRGNVREAQRTAEGRRPGRPLCDDHRRDARRVRHRRAAGTRSPTRSSVATAASPSGSSRI